MSKDEAKYPVFLKFSTQNTPYGSIHSKLTGKIAAYPPKVVLELHYATEHPFESDLDQWQTK
jgi:hypothetical protein